MASKKVMPGSKNKHSPSNHGAVDRSTSLKDTCPCQARTTSWSLCFAASFEKVARSGRDMQPAYPAVLAVRLAVLAASQSTSHPPSHPSMHKRDGLRTTLPTLGICSSRKPRCPVSRVSRVPSVFIMARGISGCEVTHILICSHDGDAYLGPADTAISLHKNSNMEIEGT